MITHLGLQNYKGVSAVYALGKKNILSAPNFSGKSAVLEAIKFIYLGYIPVDGDKPDSGLKKASDIFVRSSGSRMEVRLVEDGKRYGASLSLETGKSPTMEYTGPNCDDGMRAMLNPRAYFQSTGPARINMIVGLLGDKDAASKETIVGKIKAVSLYTPDEAKEHPEAETLFRKTQSAYLEEINKLGSMGDHNPAPIKIAGLDEFLKKKKSEATAVSTRMKKTVEGMSDIATVDDQLRNLPALSDVEESLKKVTAEIATLNQKSGELTAKRQTATRDAQRLAALRSRLGIDQAAILDDAEKSLVTASADLEGLRKEAAEGKAQAAQLAVEITAKEEERDALMHEAEMLMLSVKEVRDRMADNGSWTPAPLDLNLNGEIEAKATLTFENGVVTAYILKDVLEKKPVTLQEQADADQAENEANLKAEEAEKIVEQLETLNFNLTNVEGEQETIYDTIALKDGEVSELNRKIRDAKNIMASEAADRAEMESLEGKSPEDIETEIYDNTSKLNLATSKRDSLTGTQNDIAKLNSTKDSIRRAQVQVEEAAIELEFIGEIADITSALKKKIIDGSIDAALEIANKFAVGILVSPLVYHKGEIGRMHNGVFVNLDGFSGAELTIAETAFGVALASKSANRFVLIDELSVFDNKNKMQLIKNLGKLVDSGVISQYLAVDNREDNEIANEFFLKPHPYENNGITFRQFLAAQ